MKITDNARHGCVYLCSQYFRGHGQAELRGIEASLVYIVPGQVGLQRDCSKRSPKIKVNCSSDSIPQLILTEWGWGYAFFPCTPFICMFCSGGQLNCIVNVNVYKLKKIFFPKTTGGFTIVAVNTRWQLCGQNPVSCFWSAGGESRGWNLTP